MIAQSGAAQGMGPRARLAGNLLLAAIVAAFLYGGYVIYAIKRDNRDAAAYLVATVSAMAANWDYREVERRAAPGWLAPGDADSLRALFDHLRRLGRLQSLDTPVGRVGSGAYPGTRITGTWADYSVSGRFDAGPAQFRLVLMRTEPDWLIAGLQVDADALRQAP
jgi:hypothetical protein